MKRFVHGNTYYSHAHPAEELERNFKKMKDLGLNAVRVAEIWPGWSVIEHTEGKYDYDILDDYVEKAVKNGLKVCMGVGINDTPFWLYTKYPELRFKDGSGRRSVRRVQSACIDHEEYRNHMKEYIKNITQHYAGFDGIFSWQFGNEIRYGVPVCDCPATRKRFREWLKNRYNEDLDALNKEWGTYYHDWDEIYPYKSYDGPPTEGIAPHYLRSKEFQNWSLEELVKWGCNIMREYTDLPIFHNCMNFSGDQGSQWKLTEPCDIAVIDIYATTYDKPGIYNGFLLETMRSIAKQQNKPLWIGETSAGQYGTYNRIYVNRRIIENCVIEQIGAGAKAVFYFRHKAPVWEQPHKFTGSQTFMRIDESEMKYTKTPKNVAAFMRKHEDRILSSTSVIAEVGIYYPSESIQLGKEAGFYKDAFDSAFGSRAIWSASGIPVEILDTEAIQKMDLSQFKIIHIPVSYLLPSGVGKALKDFVKNGGTLIAEGRPGYVNEHGLLYEVQPGAGLHEIFGAREDLFYLKDFYSAYMDIDGFKEKVTFPCIKQTFRLFGGSAFALDEDGDIVGVRNRYGKGIGYIFGGAPSLHYRVGGGKYETGKSSSVKSSEENRALFSRLFKLLAERSGVALPVKFSGGLVDLTTRYLENDKEILVFFTNYDEKKPALIKFYENYESIMELTLEDEIFLDSRQVTIPPASWKVISVKK